MVICDHVMESGKIRLEGSPAKLLDHPEIADLYLGGRMEKSAVPGPATNL